MKLFAHRGVMNQFPENTMAAFRAALAAHADGIETDVHLTKDGRLVLIHDETIDRTTDGSGRIAEMTLSELGRYNAGVLFDLEERIPSLDDLLNLVKGTGVCLNLEVKTDIDRYEGIEDRLVETLRAHRFPADRVLFSSFNHETLYRLKRLAPEYESAALISQPLFDLAGYLNELGATGVHPSVRTMTDDEIKLIQQNGVKVRPYTVKTIEQLKRFQLLGVDAIFVNDIEWARAHSTP
ncbi:MULTISPECIES: glycerophosphodiester phosphodiesterase [unclassified Exiguobacterium]|uniref:glycerophosphodiester phosphodiesterase n=1 Tax=unclassified Exiguobacterium TaxID=2644629 RepID=UPI00103C3079|nr:MULTISPECIES: glycerophosphodiester phosphodiesterase [unclassified Exiguobacterium]TCI35797.1 glycerophosphodiester phosphodiesterase [Exiguobacterium sp. SH4S7]TCI65128.1 glycerophosphodiester phosphodiesterase [Exiguobacterium sp. SH0S2]